MPLDGKINSLEAHPTHVSLGGETLITCNVENTGTVTQYFIIGMSVDGGAWTWTDWVLRKPGEQLGDSVRIKNIQSSTVTEAALWIGENGTSFRADHKTVTVWIQDLKPNLNIMYIGLDKKLYKPGDTASLTVTIQNVGNSTDGTLFIYKKDPGKSYYSPGFYLARNGSVDLTMSIPIVEIQSFDLFIDVLRDTIIDDSDVFPLNIDYDVEMICEPGARKCVGMDLMVCHSSGTYWMLMEADSIACKPVEDELDFWKDPLGWIINAVMGGFGEFIDWFGNTFQSWVSGVTDWINGLWADIGIAIDLNNLDLQNWVTNLIPDLSDLSDWLWGIIGDWAEGLWIDIEGLFDVHDALTKNWILDLIPDLSSLSAAVWDSVTSWVNDAIEDLKDRFNNITAGVISWIDNGFSNIGEWWKPKLGIIKALIDGAIAIGNDFWTNKMQGFSDWLGDLGMGFSAYINTQILNMQDWVKDLIPNVVDGMFDWAKGIVQPIIDAAGFLGQLAGIFTGSRPEEPEIKTTKEKVRLEKIAIEALVEEIEI